MAIGGIADQLGMYTEVDTRSSWTWVNTKTHHKIHLETNEEDEEEGNIVWKYSMVWYCKR